MKKIINTTFRILTSRVVLNLLVWFFFVDLVYNNNLHGKAPLNDAVYILNIIIMHLVWFALIYGNTSFLIPKLLLPKKYGWYILVSFFYAVLFSGIIGWYSEWLIRVYPGTEKFYYIGIGIPSRSGFKESWDYYANVFFGSVLITWIVFSLGRLMLYFFKERRRTELLQKKQMESELMLLKSQINPHFLFNVLNSIYSLSLKKSDDAPGVVLKLSDILRYMLYESRQEYVPLSKELQMLRDYIAIEQVRLSNKDAISLTIVPDHCKGYIAPAMLVSFVENAVKHGLDSLMENAFVIIEIRINEATGDLHFYCRNNYQSHPNHIAHKSEVGGIGLENVRKRLELIYPGNHSLNIIDKNNIFEVDLTLKLKINDLPYHR